MKDTALIGTDESPLRSSGLGSMVKCPWRQLSMYLFDPIDRPGPAADTGSATHAAVHRWHKDHDVLASVEVMHEKVSEYPLANLDEAVRMFVAYTKDPRNIDAKVVLGEHPIKFAIQPAVHDATERTIVVKGRLDQVREIDGKYYLFDLKTSTRDGPTLMGEAQYQVAAYCIGASIELERPVHPGALILPRKYMRNGCDPKTSPSGVFWNYVFKYEDCSFVLNGVRHIVAALRQGVSWQSAGDYCGWCHYRGIDACVPALVQLGRL